MDFSTVVEGAHKLKVVDIVYTKKSGEVVYHSIEPYSLRGDCLCGYDISEGCIKKFIIRNLVDCTLTDIDFSPRWPVEL